MKNEIELGNRESGEKIQCSCRTSSLSVYYL